MALLLTKGCRPDEAFHLQVGPPTFTVRNFLIGRQIVWEHLTDARGYQTNFVSTWLFGTALHWYRGTKIDGTRTKMYWWGQLDDGIGEPYVPDLTKYVVCDTPKEQFSVRFFVKRADPVWDNMGGS